MCVSVELQLRNSGWAVAFHPEWPFFPSLFPIVVDDVVIAGLISCYLSSESESGWRKEREEKEDDAGLSIPRLCRSGVAALTKLETNLKVSGKGDEKAIWFPKLGQ